MLRVCILGSGGFSFLKLDTRWFLGCLFVCPRPVFVGLIILCALVKALNPSGTLSASDSCTHLVPRDKVGSLHTP